MAERRARIRVLPVLRDTAEHVHQMIGDLMEIGMELHLASREGCEEVRHILIDTQADLATARANLSHAVQKMKDARRIRSEHLRAGRHDEERPAGEAAT